MPCNSDYLEPNEREKELQRAAKLLSWLKKKLGQKVSHELKEAADDYYCSDDYVPELCATLKSMSDTQREKIVYDAHDKTARNLADWWEQHQAADRAREKQEQEELRKEKLRQTALNKLSPAEREALELDED